MRAIVFASVVAALMGALVPARAPMAAEPPPTTVPPVIENDVYYVRRDPRLLVMEESVERVNRDLFGYYIQGQWSWPVTAFTDGWMFGDNGLGGHYELELNFYAETQKGQDGSYAWVWSGLLTTSRDAIVAWGYGVQLANGTRAIVPWMMEVDQASAIERHYRVLSVTGSPERTMCALDDLGTALVSRARIDADDGARKAATKCKTTALACLGGGIAGCLIAGPVGCVPGLVCLGGAILGTWLWQDEFDSEWQHTMEIICEDAAWRAAHPGEESPFDDTRFDPPVWSLIPISLD